MPTLHGINSGVIYPQPGFTVTQDQNGTWTASRDYSMRTETWNQSSIRNLFARGTFIYLIDNTLPDFWNFLTVTDKNIVHEEGGIITISVSFNGSLGFQFDNDGLSEDVLPTYRLEGRLMELPLSEHPKWKALSNDFQQALGKMLTGEATVSPDYLKPGYYQNDVFYFIKDASDNVITFTGNAITFAKLICNGTTTYTASTVTYTETTTGESPVTNQQLAKLGKISNPRGNPPSFAGDYNWMLTGASQEQRGTIYQTSFEWTLSGESGWDDFLYE